MKFILGKKIAMSQRFRDDGTVVPVTVVEAGPCTVTGVRTMKQDRYAAVALGFGERKKLGKPLAGALKGLKPVRTIREFRLDSDAKFERGATITAEVFAPGDKVTVVGTSKGRGFAGVVKRHHFAGHPASHGHKDQLRMPGSIGSKRQGPVEKGKRMAGRMGGDRVTVHGLEVVAVHPEKNQLEIKGAVPGARGSLLLIQSAS